MVLFLMEFIAVLWAQFLLEQGMSPAVYVAINLVVIGCNIFAVLSELGNDPVQALVRYRFPAE
jgi:hypothetical protein